MAANNIERYAPGGDIYETLAKQYGNAAANRYYAAELTPDPYDENVVLTEIRGGKLAETSTLKIFAKQITTDPLAAPLESANNVIGTLGKSAIFGLFKNPWVLLVVAAVGVYVFYSVKRKVLP